MERDRRHYRPRALFAQSSDAQEAWAAVRYLHRVETNMTLSTGQKKFLHTAIGMVAAGGGYVLVNHLSIGTDLKVPLLAIIVRVPLRGEGQLLSGIETQPPGNNS